jgi:hypothetical protein
MARAHLMHIWVYVRGDTVPLAIRHWIELDPRYQAVLDARWGGKVTTLADFNHTGYWASAASTPDGYGNRIVTRGNRIFPGLEQTPVPPSTGLVFGRVPHPPFKDMIVTKCDGCGYDRVPPRQIVGGVHHETMGRGSIEFYASFFSCPSGERCRDALVDYVIGRDGRIGRLNDPRGTRSPYASGGGVGLPGGLEGDGPAFVAKFGVSAINGRNISIEYEKLNNESLTPAQIQAGGRLMAYWHDQDGQPWEQHPFVPKYGIVCSFLHWEFGTTTCGLDMEDDLAAIQAVSKGVMREYQTAGSTTPAPTPTTPPPSEYAEPIPVPELAELADADPNTLAAIVTDEGTNYIYVNDRVRAIRDTPRLQRANPGAARVGRHIRKGQEFTVAWMFKARDGRTYYYTPAATRVLVRDTERIQD